MTSTVTAFLEDAIVASGERHAVTRKLEEQYPADHGAIIVIEDDTGRVTDLDYWDALASRQTRAPGRPKIGVQAKEITLLPRHWEWLSSQPGGASGTIRRLVDQAQRQEPSDRSKKDAAYRFMQATCGDRPGYEEALRALYKDEAESFSSFVAGWPEDIRAYLLRLAGLQ
jgi:hypothetical protein